MINYPTIQYKQYKTRVSCIATGHTYGIIYFNLVVHYIVDEDLKFDIISIHVMPGKAISIFSSNHDVFALDLLQITNKCFLGTGSK